MAQYGPHRWSAGRHDDGDNDRFRGARFMVADLGGVATVESAPGDGTTLSVRLPLDGRQDRHG